MGQVTGVRSAACGPRPRLSDRLRPAREGVVRAQLDELRHQRRRQMVPHALDHLEAGTGNRCRGGPAAALTPNSKVWVSDNSKKFFQ